MSKKQELMMYVVLAFAGVAFIVGAYFFVPPSVATKKQVRSEIAKAIGASVIPAAEKNVAQQAAQAGLTVTKMTVDHTSTDKNGDVHIYLVIDTVEGGIMRLDVTASKSVWQVTKIKRVS